MIAGITPDTKPTTTATEIDTITGQTEKGTLYHKLAKYIEANTSIDKCFKDLKERNIISEEEYKLAINDIDTFSRYLIEIWRDLAHRSSEDAKGLEKLTFITYYDLPGIISDRLFAVLDKNSNGTLDPKEFIEGLTYQLFFLGYFSHYKDLRLYSNGKKMSNTIGNYLCEIIFAYIIAMNIKNV